jgi:hypothetical protein
MNSSLHHTSSHRSRNFLNLAVCIFTANGVKKIDYEKMYKDVIKIYPKIRLVTICDSKGRVIYSEHHEGVKNATREESKESQEVSLSS